MKIIITVNTYYPLKDGVQFVTGYLAEGLAKKGYEVTVLTTNPGTLEKEVYKDVIVERVKLYTKHTFYVGDKEKYVNLVLSKSKEVDVLINICTQNPMTDLILPVLGKIGCKKILYMHGMYDPKWHLCTFKSMADIGHKVWNNVRWGKYYIESSKYFKMYDHIIQLHEYDYAYKYFMKKYHIQCDVIENAAADTFFNNSENREKYAISVANFMPRKNQEYILRAFYKAKIEKKYGLILIGSEKNSYYDKLIKIREELEKKYGKRNVKIIFGISREETVSYIKKASIYLMGSKWEAFPISIVEAMAAGIPFISTDVGIVRYLLGGVVVNSEEEMAYWISKLVHNYMVADQLGNVGRLYARDNLSIETKLKQLVDILEE